VFGKQFSIGGDFIANYHNTKIFHSNDNTGEFEDWNKGISIVKSLKLRFYF